MNANSSIPFVTRPTMAPCGTRQPLLSGFLAQLWEMFLLARRVGSWTMARCFRCPGGNYRCMLDLARRRVSSKLGTRDAVSVSAGSRSDVYPCALSGRQGILLAHRVPAPFLRRCVKNHRILTRCGFPARCAMASFYRFRGTRQCGHLKGIWSATTGTPSRTHTKRQTKPLTSAQPDSRQSPVLERSGAGSRRRFAAERYTDIPTATVSCITWRAGKRRDD